MECVQFGNCAGPVRSRHDCKSLRFSPEVLAELGWNGGGSREPGNVFTSGLGGLPLWPDGSKLEAKVAADWGKSEAFLEAKPGKQVTSGGDSWESAGSFLLSLHRQLRIYANRRWEDTKSTGYTDKPHFCINFTFLAHEPYLSPLWLTCSNICSL